MKLRGSLLFAGAGLVLSGFTLLPVLRAQQNGGEASTGTSGGWLRRPLWRQLGEKLQLSLDQKKAALSVIRQHEPALRPLVNDVLQQRFALRKLQEASSIDEAAVRAQSGRVASTEADLAVQKAYLMHDLRAVATPEQLKMVEQFEAETETKLLDVVERVGDWLAQS